MQRHGLHVVVCGWGIKGGTVGHRWSATRRLKTGITAGDIHATIVNQMKPAEAAVRRRTLYAAPAWRYLQRTSLPRAIWAAIAFGGPAARQVRRRCRRWQTRLRNRARRREEFAAPAISARGTQPEDADGRRAGSREQSTSSPKSVGENGKPAAQSKAHVTLISTGCYANLLSPAIPGPGCQLGKESDRPVYPGETGSQRARAGAAGIQTHSPAPGLFRFDRHAAHTR